MSHALLKRGGDISLADRGIGTFVLIACATNIIAARSTAIALPLLALVTVMIAYYERTPIRGLFRPVPESVPVALLLCFAAMSAAWSADPAATLWFTVIILAIFLLWHVINYWVSVQPVRRIRYLAYWFPIAVLIGLSVLLFEVYAQQWLRRAIVENFGILTPPTLSKHYRIDSLGNVHIQGFELNRSVAVLNMYVWPAVLCAFSCWSGRKFQIIAALLAGGTLLTTVGSTHETSKLAVVAGILCFVLARYWRRTALVSVAVVWNAAVLGIVFVANVAQDKLNLHKAGWLQHSAQERIVIWNDVADRISEAPFIGVGARTAYVMRSQPETSVGSKNIATEQPPKIARHAHNMYLQTWFELGAAGAVLLLIAGLVAIRAMTKLSAVAMPYALATFAVFMVEIGSTWEIWQRWLPALFALTMVWLTVGLQSLEAKLTEEAPPS